MLRPLPGNSIELSEKAGVRYLHFGADWIQGAMRLQRPNALELAYTREMMAGLLFHEPPWPQKVLLIGLGAGSLAKFIYHKFPETHITVVEINPQVETVARLHFKLPDDPERLKIVIGDGVEFMSNGKTKFEAIFVDGFDRNGDAGPLDSLPFYEACRDRLTKDGLMSVNLLGKKRGFEKPSERILSAFNGRSLVFPSCDTGNAIAFAATGDPIDIPCAELIAQADAVYRKTGLNLAFVIPRLQTSGTWVEDRLLL